MFVVINLTIRNVRARSTPFGANPTSLHLGFEVVTNISIDEDHDTAARSAEAWWSDREHGVGT